jgi:hypothetical protein
MIDFRGSWFSYQFSLLFLSIALGWLGAAALDELDVL